MPELPRKPAVSVEPKEERDPLAAPVESAPLSAPGASEAAPAMSQPAATQPPLSDAPGDDVMAQPGDVTDGAADDAVDGVADAMPDAGEAAAIGAMSAAEAAVRQRAEADYQRAVDDAIRAAQWRTDDAVYVGLVDELVRLRGPGGVGSGSLSSAARAAGGDDAPWSAPGRAPGAGAWGGDGDAAYGAFGEADASGGGPRLRSAVYGSDDERGSAEQVQFAVPLPMPPPPIGAPPRPGDTDYAGAWKELKKLWGQLPDFDDLPEVEKPFFMQLLEAIASLLYNKPPHDAKDPNGAKAPGKPGEAEGFRDPKGGERWVPNPNTKVGGSHGWLDDKGRVWVPTGPKRSRAHGPPHWDVQLPKGKYVNVEPGEHINDAIKKKGL